MEEKEKNRSNVKITNSTDQWTNERKTLRKQKSTLSEDDLLNERVSSRRSHHVELFSIANFFLVSVGNDESQLTVESILIKS